MKPVPLLLMRLLLPGLFLFFQIQYVAFGSTTNQADLSGITSDDFSAPELNTSIWTFIDPVGDASYQLSETRLQIFLPEGSDHDIWTGGNRSARLMQPANNTDFELEVRFDVRLSRDYTAQGILIEMDENNFLRFDFNAHNAGVRIFAASFVNGAPNTRLLQNISFSGILFMRIKRAGDLWTQSYSHNRRDWLAGASFTHSLTVTAVGLFAANAGVFPTLTASIDYFFNTASPVVPEDGVTTAPAPPVDLAAAAISMAKIRLSWTDNNDGEDGYVIERSDDNVVYAEIARTEANTAEYVDQVNSAGGTFYYRLAAVNSLGESGYSNPVQVTLPTAPVISLFYGETQRFGHIGTPQRFVNILGNISDAGQVDHVSYILNGRPEESFNIGSDRMRLALDGDFNLELATTWLTPGNNALTVFAVASGGAVSSRSMSFIWQNSQAPVSDIVVDWQTVTNIQDVAQVIDGKWQIGNGVLRTAEVGFDRLVAFGDTTWASYEIIVPVTIHNFYYTSGEGSGPGVGILAHWKGHDGNDRPRLGHPYGILAWYRDHPPGPNNYRLLLYKNGDTAVAEDLSARKLALNTTYLFKLNVQTMTGDLTNYKFKVWEASAAEPGAWTLEATVTGPIAGSPVLVAHKADVSFGDVSIRAIQKTAVEVAAQTEPAAENLVSGFYPNPFNETTRLRFLLDQEHDVRLEIFNVLGELLAAPLDAVMPPGLHQLAWNGRDRFGAQQPSGIYFYSLTVGQQVYNGRMMLIR